MGATAATQSENIAQTAGKRKNLKFRSARIRDEARHTEYGCGHPKCQKLKVRAFRVRDAAR